jgi:hypothetical protein
MDNEARRRGIFERLKHSLQALAAEASVQVQLFPDFVHKNDELVLDFDHWQDCAIGNYGKEMTAAQLQSLRAINDHLETVGPADAAVWDEDGLYTVPFWSELRQLAIQSLESFGWPKETPPGDADEYVRGEKPIDTGLV